MDKKSHQNKEISTRDMGENENLFNIFPKEKQEKKEIYVIDFSKKIYGIRFKCLKTI